MIGLTSHTAIVEKTAGYVARNGPVFEDRIREKEISNPKFSFLSPNDAYTPFYLWRLAEIRSGRGTNISAGRTDTVPAEQAPKGPQPPPDFQFSARMPNISALDLEVVKLTALHVARKGKSWMTALSQREARNYQFDFLRPQHSLYNFFQRLVDQYSLLLQTGPEGQKSEAVRLSALKSNIKNKFRTMESAKKRAEYLKWVETQKQQKEEEEQAEQLAYAQIDWHDFVVVETVLFTEADDEAALPPPTSLNDLQSASLEQKAMMSLARPDMRIEEAMPIDDMGAYAYAGQTNGYGQNMTFSPQPAMPQLQSMAMDYTPIPPQQYLASVPTTQSTYSPPAIATSAVKAASVSGRPQAQPTPPPMASATAPMKIRNDYVPRAQARQKAANTVLCPVCKQQILIDEFEQHRRIESLDPQWKEQRAKADARFASTNLGGTDVAANLKRMRAKAEGGSAPDAQLLAAADEEERRKRMRAESDGVQMPNAQPAGKEVNVQDQIRQIHQRYSS